MDNAPDLKGRVVHVMYRNSDTLRDMGLRDKPYEEKAYVVSFVRKLFPDRGEQDRPGPYGTGLIQFFTEGMSKNHGFGHTIDVADIILIE